LIVGEVSADGVPFINLSIAGRKWTAIIDTGFNGDLELPILLKNQLQAIPIGQIDSFLAGGQRIQEEAYTVKFPFDGKILQADVTFVDGDTILLGTRLIALHRLEIVFPRRTLVLERIQ
jgi:predicted aspartyl protease